MSRRARACVGLVGVICVVTAGCTREVRLAVDARAADADATLQVAVYADDDVDGGGGGGGCEPWRFSERPALTALAVAVLDDDDGFELSVPRLGDKLFVVDAVSAGASVARGCAAVSAVDSVVDVDVVLAPTTRIAAVSGDVVFADAGDGLAAVVTDSGGAGVAVAVSAVANDAAGAVVADDVLASDADGAVVFAPALSVPGPLRLTLVPENPAAADVLGAAAVVADAFVTPRVEPLGGAASGALEDPAVVVVDGAVGVVDHVVAVEGGAGGGETSARLTAFVGETRIALGPPAGRLDLLGAFAGDDGGDTLFFAVSDAFDGGAVRVVDTDGAVVDEVSLGFDVFGAVAVSAASCTGGRERPVLLVAGDRAVYVDVAFGSVVAVPAAGFGGAPPAVSGCVAVRGEDARHRVIFSSSSAAGGPKDLGAAADRIVDADAIVPVPLAIEDRVIHYAVRDDGVVLAARVDGAEVLVVPRVIAGAALVPAAEPTVRLPSAPVLLAQGRFFSAAGDGANDVVAILDLATAADPSANALFGAVPVDGGGAIDGGVDLGVCRPLSSCPRSRFVDVDGDGKVDLVTFREGDGAALSAVVVRFGVR